MAVRTNDVSRASQERSQTAGIVIVVVPMRIMAGAALQRCAGAVEPILVIHVRNWSKSRPVGRGIIVNNADRMLLPHIRAEIGIRGIVQCARISNAIPNTGKQLLCADKHGANAQLAVMTAETGQRYIIYSTDNCRRCECAVHGIAAG